MRTNFLAVLLILIVNLAELLMFKCKFSGKYYGEDYKYGCKIESNSTTEPEEHYSKHSDIDVKYVLFSIKDSNFTKSDLDSLRERFINLDSIILSDIQTMDENLLENWSNLKNFDLIRTETQKLPELFFATNPNIHYLSIHNNTLTDMPENLFKNQEKLKHLMIAEHNLIDLPENIFKPVKNLEFFGLFCTKIQRLNPIWFKEMKNLISLRIGSNEILGIQKNIFEPIKNLNKLYFKVPKLKVLHSDSFGNLKNLSSFTLITENLVALDEKIFTEANKTLRDYSIKRNLTDPVKLTHLNSNKTKLNEYFLNYLQLKNLNENCGKRKTLKPMIIGGKQISRGDYPWIAALVTANRSDFFCGGTLISNDTVITAAHCIQGKSYKPNFKTYDFHVILGAYNLKASEPKREIIGVKKIYIHSDWDPHSASYDADIAILKLSSEAPFGDFIQPICMMELNSFESTISVGEIAGFGKDKNGAYGGIANVIKSPIISAQQCSVIQKDLQSMTSSRTICGGYANGTGICEGDSGSGLIVFDGSNYFLRGIASTSLNDEINSCNVKKHSVFTDVLKFTSWIKSGGENECEDKIKILEDKLDLQEKSNKQEVEELKVKIKKLEEELKGYKDRLICFG